MILGPLALVLHVDFYMKLGNYGFTVTEIADFRTHRNYGSFTIICFTA
jgi:hypothetical protein